jgi:maleylacetate reductase
MRRLAEALGASQGDEAGALWDLAVASDVPTSLAQLGLAEDDLPEVAERAAGEITVNPVPVDAAALLQLLLRAYVGERPAPSGVAA